MATLDELRQRMGLTGSSEEEELTAESLRKRMAGETSPTEKLTAESLRKRMAKFPEGPPVPKTPGDQHPDYTMRPPAIDPLTEGLIEKPSILPWVTNPQRAPEKVPDFTAPRDQHPPRQQPLLDPDRPFEEQLPDAAETPEWMKPPATGQVQGEGDPVLARLPTFGSMLGRGVGEVGAGTAKSLGIAEAGRARTAMDVFEGIDKGEYESEWNPYVQLSPAMGDAGMKKDILEYFEASPSRRRQIRNKYAPQTDPREQPYYQRGERLGVWLEESLPVNQEYAKEFWAGQVPHGFGTAAGFGAIGIISRGAGFGTFVAPAGAGAALQAAGQFEDALNSGADIDEAFTAAGWGALIGTSEALPIAHLLNRVDKMVGGGIKRALWDVVVQGSEEAIQEFFQQFAQNATAKWLVAYDPERGVFEGTVDGAKVGFTVGALMQTMFALAMPGRYRRGQLPDAHMRAIEEFEKRWNEGAAAYARGEMNISGPGAATITEYTTPESEAAPLKGRKPPRAPQSDPAAGVSPGLLGIAKPMTPQAEEATDLEARQAERRARRGMDPAQRLYEELGGDPTDADMTDGDMFALIYGDDPRAATAAATAEGQRLAAAYRGLFNDLAAELGKVMATKGGRLPSNLQSKSPKAAAKDILGHMLQFAREGAKGRFWYEKSARKILEITHGNKEDAEKFIQLLAIYSPRANVPTNFQKALKAWNQWKAGEPIEGNGFADRDARARELLIDGVPFEGRKINSFYSNLMFEIDPAQIGKVTGDMWMARAAQFADINVHGRKYNFIEGATRLIAEEMGWTPHQAQAAVWVTAKARFDATKADAIAVAVKKGLMKLVPNSTGKGTHPEYVTKGRESEEAFFEIWRDKAFNVADVESLVEKAKKDFADSADEQLAQVSLEVLPSTSLGHFPQLHSAPIEVRNEYFVHMLGALRDENGHDIVAKVLGLLSPGAVEAPGFYAGTSELSLQTLLQTTRIAGAKKEATIAPHDLKLLEAYASIWGLVFKQDSVGWHRPIFKGPNVADMDGMTVDIGRPLTRDEMLGFTTAFEAELAKTGVKKATSENFAVISTATGVNILNNPKYTGLDHVTFHGIVRKTDYDFGPNVKVDRFGSDNDLIEGGWSDGQAEGYTSRIRRAGSPGLQGWLGNYLIPRISEAEAAFAAAHPELGLTRDPAVDRYLAENFPPVEPSAPGDMFALGEPVPGFYSKALQTVQIAPIKKGPAEQWLGVLRKAGVKNEEVAWLGIDTFLEGRKSTTREELEEFVQANQVKITEVEKGKNPQTQEERARYIELRSAAINGATLTDAEEDELMRLEREYNFEFTNPTQYDEYTLGGGTNYRELLLTLPGGKKFGVFDGEYQVLPNLFDTAQEAREAGRQMGLEGKASIREVSDTSFRAPHWSDTPNILASIRFKERVTETGERVLFIEEIQSDWHQKGRKHGYKGDKASTYTPELRAERERLVEYLNGFDRIEAVRQPEWDRLGEIDNIRREAEFGGVPDAPFKKTWHELAFRRMVRYAAENGYDQIAWTTGQQQAERYNLAKRVRDIRVEPVTMYGATTREVIGPVGSQPYAITARDFEGKTILYQGIDGQAGAAEYLGEEVAAKLFSEKNQERLASGASVGLDGLDLQIGGEGMKGFYDRILPSYASKFGKKFGAKVSRTKVGDTIRYTVVDDSGIVEGPFDDRRDAEIAAQSVRQIPGSPVRIEEEVAGINAATTGRRVMLELGRDPGEWSQLDGRERDRLLEEFWARHRFPEVHSFPITPSMKETALGEGFPMFALPPGKIKLQNYLGEIDAEMASIVAEVARRIIPIANVEMLPIATVPTSFGAQARIRGQWKPHFELIRISMNTGDPRMTVRHEAIHALRTYGMFTDPEWNLLSEESRRVWRKQFNIDEQYREVYRAQLRKNHPEMTDEALEITLEEYLTEEGIAFAFESWWKQEQDARAERPVFTRIADFFEALARALRKAFGRHTIRDIFERVEQGETGARPPQWRGKKANMAAADGPGVRVKATPKQIGEIEAVFPGEIERGTVDVADGAIIVRDLPRLVQAIRNTYHPEWGIEVHPAVTRSMNSLADKLESLPQGDMLAFEPGSNYTGLIASASVDFKLPDNIEPLRREKILGDLAKDLNIPIYTGNIRGKRRAGFYRPGTEEVRIRNASDLEVAMHELAHLIDDRFPEIRRNWDRRYKSDPAVAEEIEALRAELEGVSYDKGKLFEGFAEFVRLWGTQKGEALSRAPHLYRMWEQWLEGSEHGPALRRAQERMHAWFAQHELDKALSKTGDGGHVNDALQASFSRRFRQGTVDYVQSILWAEEQLTGEKYGGMYQLARLVAGSSGTVQATMLYGAPKWVNGEIRLVDENGKERFTVENGRVVEGEGDAWGLEEVLRPVADDLRNFGLYAIGRRAQVLMMEGRENLFTKAEIDAMLELETPVRREAFERWNKLNSQVLDFAEQSGLIDPVKRVSWETAVYLPFYRVVEGQTRSGVARGPKGEMNVIKRLKGGTANLGDPIANMHKNLKMLVEASIANHAKREILNTFATAKGGARFLTKIPTTSKKVRVFLDSVRQGIMDRFQQIKNEEIQQVELDAEGEIDSVIEAAERIQQQAENFEDNLDSLFEQISGTIAMWQHGMAPSGNNIIAAMVNGKPVYYEVADSLLFQSLNLLPNRPDRNQAVAIMNGFRRFGQRTITYSIDFVLRNIIRDQAVAAVLSRNGYIPFIDAARGFWSRMTHDAAYKAWLANGGAMASFWSQSENFQKHLDMYYSKNGIDPGTVLNNTRKFFAFADRFLDAFETATRLGEYKRAVKKGRGLRGASFESREVSTDFSMRGDPDVHIFGKHDKMSAPLISGLYDTVLFLKPGTVGVDRVYRGFAHYDNRGTVALKTGLIAMAGTFLYLVNAYYNEDELDELEDWDRDMHWHIWIPDGEGGKHHFRLPKPWEIGGIGTIAERTMEGIMKKDPSQIPKMLNVIREMFRYEWVPFVVQPTVELWTNRSRFFDRPIIPARLEGASPSEQYSGYTSRSMRAIGKAVDETPLEGYLTSPIVMEHLLRGYFNTWAHYGLMLADAAFFDNIPDLRVDQYPGIRTLYRQDPPRGTRYRTMFYDMMREVAQVRKDANLMRNRMLGEELEEFVNRHETELSQDKLLSSASRRITMIGRQIDRITEAQSLEATQALARELADDDKYRARVRSIRNSNYWGDTGALKRELVDMMILHKNDLYKEAYTKAKELEGG